MRRSHSFGGGGGGRMSIYVLISEALPLLGLFNGLFMYCSCIVVIHVGGGGGFSRISMYCTSH